MSERKSEKSCVGRSVWSEMRLERTNASASAKLRCDSTLVNRKLDRMGSFSMSCVTSARMRDQTNSERGRLEAAGLGGALPALAASLRAAAAASAWSMASDQSSQTSVALVDCRYDGMDWPQSVLSTSGCCRPAEASRGALAPLPDGPAAARHRQQAPVCGSARVGGGCGCD